jgi:hypothetical protein
MTAAFAGELGEISNFTSWEAGLTSLSENKCFSPAEPAGAEGSAQTPAANSCPPSDAAEIKVSVAQYLLPPPS